MAVKSPEDAGVEAGAGEAGEVALEVEFDDEGVLLTVVGGGEEVVLEAVESVEGAFVVSTRIGVGEEAGVPPSGAFLVEVVVNDAVAERGGEDFSRDGVFDDEGGAATGGVGAREDGVFESEEVFGGVEFKSVDVGALAFATAGGEVGGVEVGEKGGVKHYLRD